MRTLAPIAHFSRPLAWTLMAIALLHATVTSAQTVRSPYKLGPGDLIEIRVFGEPDLNVEIQLDDSGRFEYPFLGELVAGGLTVDQVSTAITNGLKGPYLVDPKVTVSILEYRPFFVDGEVENPGGYPYQPGLTLQRAITLAGGFTERAARRRVEIVRGEDPNGVAQPIEATDPVYAGDIVVVPQTFF